ncbi:MAG: diguanylate cyclase [Candidatus Zambryskibacteria bacterium]|nr:diguanylate cyclase [Candidatus Zambryskibacteria bacterium]
MGAVEKPTVLMVDDEEDLLEQGQEFFEGFNGHKFNGVTTFEEAVEKISETPGDMVAFVDIHLKGKRSGIDLLRFIQEYASHRVVPYAYTGQTSITVERKALAAGAIHVFHKPVDTLERLVVYAEESLVSRLLHKASSDDLTELHRYSSFSKLAVSELKTAKVRRDGKHPEVFSLLFINVDNFSSIGETHGYLSGDKTLQTVADVLRKGVRPTDHLCHKGGSEFLVWLPGVEGRKAVEVVNELRQRTAETQVELEESKFFTSISVGAVSTAWDEISEEDPESTLEIMIRKAHADLRKS